MRASLLVALALVALPAAADHVYTHRYVVSGRVVDGDGAPVAGVLVEAVVDGVSSLRGDCVAYDDEVRVRVFNATEANRTNAFGDFEVCAHVHALGGRAAAEVRVGGPWRSISIDRGVRLSFATLPADVDGEPPDAAWNRTVLVRARVWQPASTPLVLDGVPAEGRAIAGATVDVEVHGPNGTAVELSTDRYGDAAVYLPVTAPNGTVVVRTPGADPVVAQYGPERLRVDAILDLPPGSLGRGVPTPADERPEIPGLAALGTAAALALGACASAARRRR